MPTQEELYDEAMGDFAIGEFDSAIKKFKQVLALDSKFFDAGHALAETYFHQGNYDAAIEAAQKALSLNPQDQFAHTSLSRILC